MFRVEFKTDGPAFHDAAGPAEECIFLLNRIASALRAGEVTGPVMDTNGDRVGNWELVAHDG